MSQQPVRPYRSVPDTSAEMSGDRRVRRTRRLLSDALVALVLERGYDRVTVADVLARADVGRSTFYGHFRDKDDLLMACFDDLRADLDAGVAGPGGGPVRALFEHAHRHREVYLAMCSRRGGDMVQRRLHQFLSEAFRERPAPAGVPGEVAAHALAGTAVALLRWWLDAGMPHSPRMMADYYARLTAAA